ncbi:unnamed protein product, partial [Ectocarpus sp. 12 AP-2014]
NASSGGAAEASASQGSSSSRGASGEHMPARRGLVNGGSTCWLNTLIQLLAGPLNTTLARTLRGLSHCAWDAAMKERLPALWRLVEVATKVTSAAPGPRCIHQGFVGSAGILVPKGFAAGAQHDAGEAFLAIWGLVDSEAKAARTPLPPPLAATKLTTAENVQCVGCGVVRTAGVACSATHLMLCLGDGNNDTAPTSLQQLLDARGAAEAMGGSHYCADCSKNTSVQKVALVREAPETLVVVANRTAWSNGGTKNNRRVAFGKTATLRVEDMTSGATEQPIYGLAGIGVHIGTSLNAGHYVAYVRGQDDTWACAADTQTTEVGWEDVKVQNPSIFVLEKRREGGAAATHGTDVTAFWSAAVAAAREQASGPA